MTSTLIYLLTVPAPLSLFPLPPQGERVRGLLASEVMEETTRVIIREHPKTGKPYVSIVSSKIAEPPDPFTGQRARIIRPDYRMLDPKIKSGKIPYEGPVSDRTKVYVLAASLATLGVAGAAALPVASVAAGSAGAAGGAGALAAAGTAVTVGPAAAALIAAKPDSKKGAYDHQSEYRNIQAGEMTCERGGVCEGGNDASLRAKRSNLKTAGSEIASATIGVPPRND